jgi:hypothetical protein
MPQRKKLKRISKWKAVPILVWLEQHGYEGDDRWRGDVVRVKVK